MRTVPLDMLGPEDCARLAEAHGAPAVLCDRLAQRARGLPLAAVLLAAEARRNASLPEDLGEELVRALTRRCLDHAPSAAHREALLACALARRATRDLLTHLFGHAQAEALFEWLAAQGYVTASREGLRLHDLMREAVLADTGGCDRDRFRTLRRATARYLAVRIDSGRLAWETLVDFLYSMRYSAEMKHVFDFGSLGRVQAGYAQPTEHDSVRRLAARLLPASERLHLDRWIDDPATELVVARDEDGCVLGAVQLLRLDLLRRSDAQTDPVVSAIHRTLAGSLASRRPGTRSYLVRQFIVDGGFAAPSPAQTALTAFCCLYNTDPRTGLIALHIPHLPYLVRMFIDSFDWQVLPGCGRTLEGTAYFAAVRDWQAEPWAAWLDRRIRQAETRRP